MFTIMTGAVEIMKLREATKGGSRVMVKDGQLEDIGESMSLDLDESFVLEVRDLG